MFVWAQMPTLNTIHHEIVILKNLNNSADLEACIISLLHHADNLRRECSYQEATCPNARVLFY